MKNPSLWPKIQAILEDVLAFPENARADALAVHAHEAPEILEEVQAFLAHETEGNALFDTAFLPTSAQDVPDQESLLPKHIGPYAILDQLGQGGMGIVYLAQRADENYVSRVAIKVLKRGMDTLEILRRFRNERQILASLNHPNIARLFDGGTTPSGNPYFVMEMVEGKPIDEFAKNLPNVAQKLMLFQKVCSAVHYAHQRSVIHRDIKPSNILVNEQGEPKLLDFGIAKLLDPNHVPGTLVTTQTHVRLLTPKYASPEQLRNEPVSTLTDIYNLGTLLYILLTNRHPYWEEGQDIQDLKKEMIFNAPRSPSERLKRDGRPKNRRKGFLPAFFSPKNAHGISLELDAITLKALHLEPERRYASAIALSDDIEAFLKGRPIAAKGDSFGYVLAKAMGRNRKPLLTSLIFLGLIMVFLNVFLKQIRKTDSEKLMAMQANQKSQELLDITMRILDGIDPKGAERDLKTVEEVTNLAVAQMEDLAFSDWESKAILLEKLAQIYYHSLVIEKAYDLADKAFQLRLANQDPDHPDQAKNLLLRGKILAAKGSPSFSYTFFEEALAIAKAHWGESHFELAPYYSRMATAYFGRGRFQKALEFSQRALDLYENANPVDHDVLADLLQRHGELLSVTKQYPKAERFLLECVNIREQLTKTSSSQGMAHFSLGMLYFYWRRDEEAVFHYHRALELQEAVVGKEHYSLAEILQQMGALYSVKSEFAKAHSSYDRAVKLLEKNAPSNLPKLVNFHLLISANYLFWGFDIQAEASAEQSLSMMEELEWFMSPDFAAPLILLAQIAIKMNAYDVADQHLNRAYEILDRSTGFKNDFGFHVLQTRCELFLKLGQINQAAALMREISSSGEDYRLRSSAHVGYSDYQTVSQTPYSSAVSFTGLNISQHNLAMHGAGLLLTQAKLSHAQGDTERAIAYLFEGIDLLEREQLQGDLLITDLWLELANLFDLQKKPKDAEYYALQAVNELECRLGHGNQRTWDAMRFFASLPR